MMTDSNGERVAVVTGGASGIGREVIRRLTTLETRVVVVDRDAAGVDALASELTAAGRKVHAYELDLLSTAEVARFWTYVDEQFGRCDVLVNSAGIAPLRWFPELRMAEWNATMGVNLTAPMVMTQCAARLMARRRWGRVVNISSVSGFRAGVGRTAYGTSKTALTGLTRQMAIELASDGITVNAVAPGPVATPLARKEHSQATTDAYHRLIPMGRYATASEVASAVMFLCSDEAAYITGHTIPVDGGYLAAGVLEL